MLGTRSVPLLRRLTQPARRLAQLARPPPFSLSLHPTVPLVAFGAGVWLALDPERPGRVQASAVAGAGAAVRAARLAGCGAAMAIDYARVRRSQAHEGGDAPAADAKRHEELQMTAGRAERRRSDAVRQGGGATLPALEDEARRTRDEAAAFGEALVARRLERERRSGAAVVWREAHARNAARLLALCVANGGLYVKLGQHVAQLDYLVPDEYTRGLSVLFEHNRCSDIADVRRVVEEELGGPPELLFASFDAEPIASASLAQVHRATRRGSGEPLAVKVQHAGMLEACAADLWAVGLAVGVAEYFFPEEFRLGWVLAELAPHLPLELDFKLEAANAARCRDFFAAGGGGGALAGRVVVPAVHAELSSTRVLTMGFEEGVSVTDIDGIARLRLRPHAVARQLSECFCAMIFGGGFVHCDPHPGNVLVRPMPGAAAAAAAASAASKTSPDVQLVLLDHGLYRELPRHFTLIYSRLWRGLVLGDADEIREAAEDMGVGPYYPLLAAMLTARPWNDILQAAEQPAALVARGTKEDQAQIAGYAAQYARQIATVLDRVPPPMLLLLKTNDCLRHAERQLTLGLGVGSLLVTLRHSLQALRQDAAERRASRRDHAPPGSAGGTYGTYGWPGLSGASWLRSCRAWLALLQLDVAVWLLRLGAESALLPRIVRELSRASKRVAQELHTTL